MHEKLKNRLMSLQICVLIKFNFLSNVMFKKFGDFEVAWVDAEVEFGGGALRCGEYVTLRKVKLETQARRLFYAL
ncbi:hypothetical protein AAHA92_18673 [Salvia divinorum]|uniref:Uncharacterized protein n=1 Tax=Salvia divinorum TaxID=28513 RepID=A0ABD1H2V0_SALDI